VDKKAIELVQAWVARMEFKHHLPWIAQEPDTLST
jgi:hypothetical protein